jgi:hypothetical protein
MSSAFTLKDPGTISQLRQLNKELMESNTCSMTNPKFYGNWDLLEVGSPEYNKKLKVKRKDVEK